MSIITGINPIMISMRDGDAIYINCSDSANSYTFIASVSKLNGLSIKIIGSITVLTVLKVWAVLKVLAVLAILAVLQYFKVISLYV